jgi:2-polyprenyl-3-methyl-5-hydroxy-6-metoxy-1,4-benzoquinol methylase
MKGWFHRPGIQDGDRTLEEQLLGLAPMLAECPGKTVLDLGCAEGLISRECLGAGAAQVRGIDVLERHIDAARSLALDPHRARFVVANLNNSPDQDDLACLSSDIVLMLAVVHKLSDPEKSLREWSQFVVSGGLLVIRLPIGSTGEIPYKHGKHKVANSRHVLPELGFRFERDEPGPRGERVHYWRRT